MATEAVGSSVVEVGGQRFDRFLELHIRHNIEEQTVIGHIKLSWPGAEQVEARVSAFQEGKEGKIYLDGQLAATPKFDTRISKGTPNSYELTLNFRGATSDLVDSSPDHPTGQINRKK